LYPIVARSYMIGCYYAGDFDGGYVQAVETHRGLHEQCGLADTGLAAHEDHGARHDSPAQNEIVFCEAGFPALRAGRWNVGQLDGNSSRFLPTVQLSNFPSDRLFDERIPRPTGITFTAPFGLVRAAFGTAEHRMALRHDPPPPRAAHRAPCSCRSACTPS